MTSYPQHIIDFLPSHLSLDELVAKAKCNRKSNTTTHKNPSLHSKKPSLNITKPSLHSKKPFLHSKKPSLHRKPVSSYSLPPHLYKKLFHNSVPDNSIRFKC